MPSDQLVLRSPFSIEIHKRTFINYLEVIILENGTVVYAVPSHQEKLIAIACEKLNLTRDELALKCPQEYYFDFMTWLCMVSKCVAVWNNNMQGKANELQRKSLIELVAAGLYGGEVVSED